MEESDDFLLVIPRNVESEVSKINEQSVFFILSSLLKGLDPQRVGYVTKTRFNKAAYLLHRRLKTAHGIDSRLPWFWFKHGPMIGIPLEQLEEMGLASVQDTENGTRIFHTGDSDSYTVAHNYEATVTQEIENLRYLPTQKMIDLVYKDKPFLDRLRAFEEYASNIGGSMFPLFDPGQVINEYLTYLVVLYPEEDLADSLKLFLRFEDMVRLITSFDPHLLNKNAVKVTSMRNLISINASFVYLEHMGEEWIEDEKIAFQHERDHLADELYELEKEILTNSYRKSRESRHSGLLKDISLEMAREV